MVTLGLRASRWLPELPKRSCVLYDEAWLAAMEQSLARLLFIVRLASR